VFDLDGTITHHDTLLPFVLGFLRRRPSRMVGMLLFVPSVVLFVCGLSDRGALKSALIRRTLGGAHRSQIDSWTAQFIERLLPRGAFAEALHAIKQHKQDGARLILLSASTDLYVPAIGQALGFDRVICTGVRWEGDRLEGHLTTPNRRGPEKARCFQMLRQEYPGLLSAAYGNAASDLEHLRLADRPLLVNGSIRARRAAERLGIACARWR
jgi:phosphatidylglycerophosphatase C